MRHLKSIFKSLLLAIAVLLAAIPLQAQQKVSNNNDDEVNKVDPSAAQAYRPGEVIVKFKETSPIKMKKVGGKFKSSGVSQVDQVFNALGVIEADQLMPRTGSIVNRAVLRSYNGQEVKDRDMSNLYCLRFESENIKSVEEAIEAIKSLADVEYAEPNYLVFTMSTDADTYTAEPLYTEQWGPAAINLDQLWAIPKLDSAERPVIAILDTGIDITHPDLEANIWTNLLEEDGAENVDDDNNGFKDDVHGWDFINQSAKIADYNGHGTHCAGIAAAVGDNGNGITGANPDAYIMPITVMQSDGTGDVATIIKGIDYAKANGANVLSMSIGSYAYSIAEEQALAKAYANATLVAAAGNDGRCIYNNHHQIGPGPCYPAAFTFVLGVEAANQSGRAGFSNWDCDGPIYSDTSWPGNSEELLHNYELRAPGVNIFSTYPQGRYKSMNGTSMACPLVAGAISRLMQCKSYEYQAVNREILFGDLIHGANQQTGIMDIMATYNISDDDRDPTLWLIATELNDEAEGDGDFRPDAGEIIDLYPTLRNDWGNATNIRLHLEMGDELEDPTLIEFISNDVDFGKNLNGYGKAKSDNPIQFRIADNCADNRHIKLKLVATCDEISEPMVQNIIIVVENGVEIGGTLNSDMTLYPNVHYIVTRSIGVPQGVTLTILPGTRLEFNENCFIAVPKTGLIAHGTPENPIIFTSREGQGPWGGIRLNTSNAYNSNYEKDTLSYCKIDNITMETNSINAILNDCVISSISGRNSDLFSKSSGERNNFINSDCDQLTSGPYNQLHCNFVNVHHKSRFAETSHTWYYSTFDCSNVINTLSNAKSGNEYNNINYIFGRDGGVSIIHSSTPSWLGTNKEELINPHIYGANNPDITDVLTVTDLSNMPTRPYAEAHGIVWKVVVDGYDAQDEFDLLPPLGVGRHKFEVYFNRDDMDTSITPMLTMGVRPPYTQIGIAEDGSWSIKDNVSVYTAYLNITGKLQADGLNRIYVSGAQDGEHFEIPYENTRFNVLVQAAGSMATGFAAEAGLGKVNLTWNNENNNFDDAMGFNVYRFQLNANNDTINKVRVNETIIDLETEQYTDFDVTAGETYYYYYKVMSTDLKEYDISNVVAATPLTSIKGDANGSMSVNVADVVSIVSYLSLQDPQPFIFDAADVNEDGIINILDIVGVINIIAHPNGASVAVADANVVYTIEDGILYVDSPVALGGVQVTVNAPAGAEIRTLEALDGMERTWIQIDENTRMLLSYSMSGQTVPAGKVALLDLNSYEMTDMVVSDTRGNELTLVNGAVPTVVDDITAGRAVRHPGIYDLMGRKISDHAADISRLQPGIYIVDGQKVVKK